MPGTLSEVLNINFSCESPWSQATLQVCFGGIGVRRASQLAPSALLASADAWFPTTSSTKLCLLSFLTFHTQLLMPLLCSGERVTTIHLLSPLQVPDKSLGTSLMCKRHVISSYRVPLTAGLVPGYWLQPLKCLGPGCMPSLSLP